MATRGTWASGPWCAARRAAAPERRTIRLMRSRGRRSRSRTPRLWRPAPRRGPWRKGKRSSRWQRAHAYRTRATSSNACGRPVHRGAKAGVRGGASSGAGERRTNGELSVTAATDCGGGVRLRPRQRAGVGARAPTSGAPSGPSKQSISTQRQPIMRTRLYMSDDESDVSWLRVMYVLCEVEIK